MTDGQLLMLQDKSGRNTFNCSSPRTRLLGAMLVQVLHPILEMLWKWLVSSSRQKPWVSRASPLHLCSRSHTYYFYHDSFLFLSTFPLLTQVNHLSPVLLMLICSHHFFDAKESHLLIVKTNVVETNRGYKGKSIFIMLILLFKQS